MKVMKVGPKKHPSKENISLQGFLCRNENGDLALFIGQDGHIALDRSEHGYWEEANLGAFPVLLPKKLYPELTWDDEPLAVEAEIALTLKK